MIVVGGKERSIMKKSAQFLSNKIKGSRLYISQKMGHGELSLANPEEYVRLIKEFTNQ
jgi:hypothetical protein